ncbi:MAG: tetratricopeptide repeat protein [Candidatus Omnitrophota bacterium]
MIKLIVTLIFCFPVLLFADTITLKSGKVIEGKVLENTDQYIKVDYKGKEVYYKHKYIESIEETGPQIKLSEDEAVLKDPNYYLKQGLKHGANAEFDQAEAFFNRGMEEFSSDHNLKEALKVIEHLKAGKVEEGYVLSLFKGSDYIINQRYEDSIKEFKKALKIKPDDPDVNYYLGVSHYSLEQFPEAIGYLQKALGSQLDDEVYYYLGVAHYSLGQFQEAIEYLEKSLEISPDDAEAHSILGVCSYLSGKLEKAKYNLKRAIELFKDQGDYLKAIEIEEFLNKLS